MYDYLLSRLDISKNGFGIAEAFSNPDSIGQLPLTEENDSFNGLTDYEPDWHFSFAVHQLSLLNKNREFQGILLHNIPWKAILVLHEILVYGI